MEYVGPVHKLLRMFAVSGVVHRYPQDCSRPTPRLSERAESLVHGCVSPTEMGRAGQRVPYRQTRMHRLYGNQDIPFVAYSVPKCCKYNSAKQFNC